LAEYHAGNILTRQQYTDHIDENHREPSATIRDSSLEKGSGLDKVIINIELYQLPAPKFQADENSMQVILYGPRPFANMTQTERVRACYQHAVIKYLSGERMKNASLCKRFGIERKNADQASQVLKAAIKAGCIRVADPEHPRAGYTLWWA